MKSKIWTDGLKQLQDLLKPVEGKIGIAFEFIDAQVLNKFYKSYLFYFKLTEHIVYIKINLYILLLSITKAASSIS